MQPAKLNYKIYQGSTFQESYRWESETKVYVPISSISRSAPCVITTATAHNLPQGWRFRVVGAGGMKEINSVGEDGYYISTGNASIKDYLESIWIEQEQMWLEARQQDIEAAAPATRPWASLPSYLAYTAITNYVTPPGVTPPPNNLSVVAKTAKDAWEAWQIDTSATNTIEINQVNSLGFNAYTSGGVVEYNMPVNLFGYNARMQIRETVDSPDVIYSASTVDNTGLRIDLELNSINIDIPAAITQGFDFTTAVYSLELYKAGEVVPFLAGNLTLIPEVTR